MQKNHAGYRLRQVIAYLGINQADFAEMIGVNQSSISRWCTMEHFSLTILSKLEILNRRGINLLYFTESEEPMLIKDRDDITVYRKKIAVLQSKIIELQEKILAYEKKGAD